MTIPTKAAELVSHDHHLFKFEVYLVVLSSERIEQGL